MTLPLAAIISEISSTQNTHIKILSGPLKGWSNTVYEIQSEHGDRWCLRIPKTPTQLTSPQKGTSVLMEAKEKCPALLAPAVVYQSQYYTLMDYLDGEALKSWNTQVLPKERRHVLLDGLATFLFSLWSLEETQDTQRTKPKMTYRKLLRNEVDKGLVRTLEGNSAWGDPIHYLYRRVTIDDLVPYPDDGVATLKHGDLNACNVVVNERGLSGLGYRPIHTCPFSYPPSSFIADIPGWLNEDVSEGMTFEEDRAYLEHAIAKLDASSKNPGRIEHLLRTSFERQFLEMSLRNRKINAEYVQRVFKYDAILDKNAALEQLEDFLSVNESMRALLQY